MAGAVDRGSGFAERQAGQQTSAGGVLETARDKAQELASSAATKAEEAWDRTRQGAQELASHVAGTAEEAWVSVHTFFRRYPVTMFCVGLGLGFLIARALEAMPNDMTQRMSRANRSQE